VTEHYLVLRDLNIGCAIATIGFLMTVARVHHPLGVFAAVQ
jgi:hypothetical protein